MARESLEPILLTDTCAAWITEGGLLNVCWPSPIAHSSVADPTEHLETLLEAGPHIGTASAPETPAGCTLGTIIEFSMATALAGDAMLRDYRNGVAVVVQHACPPTRHVWLGPWDATTAEQLLIGLRARLALPRALGPLLTPTEAELSSNPHRYHGSLIAVEGRWQRAHEAPSFVSGSILVFPPGHPEPDRPTRVRVQGLWIVDQRGGIGPARSIHAHSVEVVPWATNLPHTHPRILGLPLPECFIASIRENRWRPGLLNGTRLLCATGWARELDIFLSPSEIEAEILRLRALGADEKRRLGFDKDASGCLDEERTLVLASNMDGRMIALDYRLDPPSLMYSEDVRGELRWRRLSGDFDEFESRFIGQSITPDSW
ncbi:hypothetical protein LZC95_28755 [Pendulispora brunnea]|uniref:Uncharacterized protein n=1 Tax=Pendulispora brunnea TaxID=2905690 RepID=A0ABZ2JXE9_9BACT